MSHILLIDDDNITNFLNKKIILNSGLADSIEAFDSGNEAIKYIHDILDGMLSKEVPDLILLDIMMPVMDGFDVLDELQKLPAATRENMRVIMLSSSLDKRDQERAMGYDMVTDFLSKPLTIKNIREALPQ
jgi:CheY-like chemotaxis protein